MSLDLVACGSNTSHKVVLLGWHNVLKNEASKCPQAGHTPSNSSTHSTAPCCPQFRRLCQVPMTPCELYRVPWGRVTVGREKSVSHVRSEEAAWRRWLWPGP